MIQAFTIYLLIGTMAGVLAGLLGIGGGLLIVPALLFVFTDQDLSPTVAMHMAIGTSMATICATSLTSIQVHHSYKAVLWSIVMAMTPGISIGAIGSAVLAGFLPGELLKNLLGWFVFIIALVMGLELKPYPQRQFPGSMEATLNSLLIGGLSALFGIGGGSLIVPYLLWCNIQMRHAIATAGACGLPLSLAGTIGFVISGWGVAERPLYSSGFIYWPAFIGIVISSTVSARTSAHLTHQLPSVWLRRIFAVLLCWVGLKLLWY